MTLKQSEGPKSYNKNVNPEQVFYHAKFERARFNSVRKKPTTLKVFFKQRSIRQLSPLNMNEKNKNDIHDLLDVMNNQLDCLTLV